MDNRNLTIMNINHVVGGLAFFLPVIALYFNHYIDSMTLIGIIFGIEALALLLFEIPSGAFADLFGRKNTLILSQLISIIALIVLYFGKSFIPILVFVILNSLDRSLKSGTNVALIYDTLKEQNREKEYKKRIGRYFSLWPLGASIAAIVGSRLAAISFDLTALFSIIPAIICLVLFLFLKEPKYHKESDHNLLKHMKESTKFLLSKKNLLLLSIVVLLIYAFGESIHRINSVFFSYKGISIENIGLFAFVAYGCSFLGNTFSHKISGLLGEKKTFILSAIGSPTFVLIATYLNGNWSGLFYALPSFFWGVRHPIISHMTQKLVPSSKRATVSSIVSFSGQLGVFLISPVLGIISTYYTINMAFIFGAVCMYSVPILFSRIKV